MELSKNFTLRELTYSPTAIRKGINNIPDEKVIENLKDLTTHLLQPIRDALGKPIKVTSGYRSPKLNKAIGGAKNSQHIEGKAVDIQVEGMTIEELFQFISKNFYYDQIIQEFDSWVHVSWNAPSNRMQKLRATKKGTKTIYTAV